MDINTYIEKAKAFFQTAQELNFDLVALYAKEPQMMQIVAGVILVIVFIILMKIKSSMKKAGGQKALQTLESYVESFEEYQENLQKIIKVLPSAKADFIENLEAKKEQYYKEQLATLRDLSLPQKIEKYQQMAKTYAELAKAARKSEALQSFYEEKLQEILTKELFEEIANYLNDFDFNEEDVVVLEEIVAFAKTQENQEEIIKLITKKLEGEDFGSSLEIFTFVRNLNPETLGEIYDYCVEQQAKLFENGERVVAAEVLEYLLENNEEEKVIAYVESLKVPTHLQELYYRFFNQKENQDLDFAFIANPLEITQGYAKYIEELITKEWRDDKALEAILERKNVESLIGHDRYRIVIERIDELRKVIDEQKMAQEALTLAQEAHRMAKELQVLVGKEREEALEQLEAQEIKEDLEETEVSPKQVQPL
jgi:hypothetical protein